MDLEKHINSTEEIFDCIFDWPSVGSLGSMKRSNMVKDSLTEC